MGALTKVHYRIVDRPKLSSLVDFTRTDLTREYGRLLPVVHAIRSAVQTFMNRTTTFRENVVLHFK